MKYLKMFENTDYDNKVLEGNKRIFMELDIIEDFKINLMDADVLFNSAGSSHIYVNFKSKNYILTRENETNLFISEINKNIDIELPTFNYHILIIDSNVELIKEQLDILNKRFDDLTTCLLDYESIHISNKKNKIRMHGGYSIVEQSNINLKLVYMNRKSDRYI